MVSGSDSLDFARAFGDALSQFLKNKGIKQSDAARTLGTGKARLNTYCHDSPRGTRPRPDAEILYLVCTKLGFNFKYKGYAIGAANLSGNGHQRAENVTQQFTLQFDRQFNLTDQQGSVTVKVKRPPESIELLLSLKARA